MIKHTTPTGDLLAVSGPVDGSTPPVTVVVAGINAETHVNTIVPQLPDCPQSTAEGIVLWHTPAEGSLTGQSLLRRLFLDRSAVSWGPPLRITDRPDIEATVAKLVAAMRA